MLNMPWKRILLLLVALLSGIAASGLTYLYVRKPAMAPPVAIRVDMSPERIARGKHLYERVMDCDGCHSQGDIARFGRPVIEGHGKGYVFPAEMGMPGTVVASNITPDRETGIGAWTGGEKIRAIREGIGRDGQALFPMMPYPYYRNLSDDDVQSLVAYLNTLPAVRNPLPRTSLQFPVSLMIKGVPQPVASVGTP